MTCFADKAIVMFAAAYAGLALHADACPKQNVPATDRRGPRISRVAIAGLLDVDHDGKSDLEVIRRLIKQNGGRIDAEFGIDGELTGELSPETDYIILGELPDETTVSRKVTKRFYAIMRRAAELNTRIVHLDSLLRNRSVRTPSKTEAGPLFRLRRAPAGGY